MNGDLDGHAAFKRVTVIGTGLIGTSIALAVRRAGIEVLLIDRDPAVARLAAELGAGTPWTGGPADLAVLAVPPPAVAAALRDAQDRGLAAVYTDVAGVKGPPLAEAARLGCDLRSFVAGHPMGGSERSGPPAARPDLFVGRPWVLCPTAETGEAAVATVTGMVVACGASPVTMDAADHDHAMALVSHAPHVVAGAMAARFVGAPPSTANIAGQGVRDTTRIAAGDPALWREILTANARPVADVVEAVADDLAATAAALRAPDPAAVGDLLVRGVAGHGRIPAKHGMSAARHTTVTVLVADRPGELAMVFQAAGVAGVNIEDVKIEHLRGRPIGVLELSVEPAAGPRLIAELRARGWSVPDREEPDAADTR